jgi:hypothetical protein
MTAQKPARSQSRAFRLGCALSAFRRARRLQHTDEVDDRERSRRLSPASSDRDPGSQPLDRHLRRPIGAAACPPSQRADVMGLAQTWLREGTGAIVADVPVDTPNARAAADTFREIQALLRPPACRRAASSCATIIRTIRASWRRSG